MDDYRDDFGVVRALGRLEPMSGHLLIRANMMSLTEYLRSIGRDLIPRSEWRPIDRRSTLGTEFINDQRTYGACVGASAAQANMRMRALRGLTFKRLSWGFIYDMINGGRDNGAVIVQSAEALTSKGATTEDAYPIPTFRADRIPQSIYDLAQHVRLSRYVTVGSFDEIGTAIQLDLFPQFPICVGSNFGRFNGDGVAGYTRGPGNHSVHGDGMVKDSQGRWIIDMPNSWTAQWGPSRNGRCYLAEAHIEGAGVADDGYVHIDDFLDPQDQNSPPQVAV